MSARDDLQRRAAIVQAVRLDSATKAAEEFGLHPSTVRRWLKEAEADGSLTRIASQICERGLFEAVEAGAFIVRRLRVEVESALDKIRDPKDATIGKLASALKALSGYQKDTIKIRAALVPAGEEIENELDEIVERHNAGVGELPPVRRRD